MLKKGLLKFFGPIWRFYTLQFTEFQIPAFQDNHSEPKITKCGDHLYAPFENVSPNFEIDDLKAVKCKTS